MKRSAVADRPLPLGHVGALLSAIAARPALRQQLGSRAYEELIGVIESPDTYVVNSIWATTLFPSVFELLRRECSEHLETIDAAAAAVRRCVYTGPRVNVRTVPCPYCGDTAVITGQFSADCWTCGPISPRR